MYAGDEIVQQDTITVKSGKSSASLVIEDLTKGTSYRLEIGGVSSKIVIYNGKTDGKVELSSVTEPQATSRKEVELMFSNLDQEQWGLWSQLPTVGLDQKIDGNTIYLSGNLTVIDKDNYADYKEAIEQWSGKAEDFDAFMASLTKQGCDVEGVEEVGFAALVVDGKVAVTCIVNIDGEPRALKNTDATFKWTPSDNVGEITVDVSGLKF